MFEPPLLAPAAARQPVKQPANPGLHVLVKEADGKRWLILANHSRREEESTLELPGLADSEVESLTDQKAPLIIRGGKANLSLPPLGTAVYQLIP